MSTTETWYRDKVLACSTALPCPVLTYSTAVPWLVLTNSTVVPASFYAPRQLPVQSAMPLRDMLLRVCCYVLPGTDLRYDTTRPSSWQHGS
eukprot:519448-Rhodomonas_salina.2